MRTRAVIIHILQALAEGALIAMLVVGLIAGTAFAAKGGNRPSGGGSSGTYSATVSPAGPYSFGESVYITTNAPTNLNPYLWLKCYQGSLLVLTSDHAAFPSGWYYNWPFILGPTGSWGFGAADCTVTVVHVSNRKIVTDATTSFHVDG